MTTAKSNFGFSSLIQGLDDIDALHIPLAVREAVAVPHRREHPVAGRVLAGVFIAFETMRRGHDHVGSDDSGSTVEWYIVHFAEEFADCRVPVATGDPPGWRRPPPRSGWDSSSAAPPRPARWSVSGGRPSRT